LFNKIYSSDSPEHKEFNSLLVKYGIERLMHEIKVTFSLIEGVFEDQGTTIINVVNPKSRNPVKESFFSIFMSFFHLIVKEEKSPADNAQIVSALIGLQKKMTSTANYSVASDREKNINLTTGL